VNKLHLSKIRSDINSLIGIVFSIGKFKKLMDKLRVLQFFLAAADQGSFISVAKQQGISPSTISKAISRLESDLALQLFYRNTRNLKLTQAGEVYAETVRHVVNELSACEYSLSKINDAPEGHLKISVPVSYGRLYIRPWMKTFNLHYPKISFELTYSDQYVDMIEQGIDVCIRSGTVQDNRLVSRRLSPIDFVTCASPDYLRQCGFTDSCFTDSNGVGPINKPSQFVNHKWIQFRFGQTGKVFPTKYMHKGVMCDFEPEKSLVVDDGEAMAELCADGFGLTQMPHFIARNWLQSGAIVSVAPSVQIESFGVHVLYPKRHYLPNRVRVFIDFLVEQLALRNEFSDKTWATDKGVFDI